MKKNVRFITNFLLLAIMLVSNVGMTTFNALEVTSYAFQSELSSEDSEVTNKEDSSEDENDVPSEELNEELSEDKSVVEDTEEISNISEAASESESSVDKSTRYRPEDLSLVDRSDAPDYYGSIEQLIAMNEIVGALEWNEALPPQIVAQDEHQGLYLGYDAPDGDLTDEDLAGGTFENDMATGDDINGERLEPVNENGSFMTDQYDNSFYSDDETGFANKRQNSDGAIEFNPYESKITFEIPYIFSEKIQVSTYDPKVCAGATADKSVTCWKPNPTKSARLLLWIDTNRNRKFDKEEGILLDESVITQYEYTIDETSGYEAGYRKVHVEYDLSDLTTAERENLYKYGTYMRLVLTSDETYGLDDAGTSPRDGSVGEIEDYRLESNIAAGTCGYALINQPEMVPENVNLSEVGNNIVTFENVENIYSANEEDNVDVKVSFYGGKDMAVKNPTKAGESINIAGAVTAHADEEGMRPKFKIEFFKTGTKTPIKVPVSLSINDLDYAEWVKFDQPFVSTSRDNDTRYGPTGNDLIEFQPNPDWPNSSIAVAAGIDYGSASTVTVNFGSVDKITGVFARSVKEGENTYRGGATGIGFTISFVRDYLEVDCPPELYSANKTADPEAGTEVAPGETINYSVTFEVGDSSAPIPSGVEFVDEIEENLEYVTDSAKMYYVATDGSKNDITSTSSIKYDDSKHTITASTDIPLSGGEQFILNFDAKVLSAAVSVGKVTNEASVNYIDLDDEKFTLDTEEIEHPIMDDLNPTESLTKEVVNPVDGKVEPGAKVQYKLGVTLTDPATSIVFNDKFIDRYLQFVQVDGVQLNGTDYTDYTVDANHELLVTVNGEFAIDDTIEVFFTAKLSNDAPAKGTFGNLASAKVDDIPTDEAAASISTGDIDVPTGDAYTDKEITAESVELDGVLQSEEDVTYKITIKNVTGEDHNYTIVDDLGAQGFWEYFDQTKSEANTVSIEGTDVTVTNPTTDPILVSDLENESSPLTINVPSGSTATITFTLVGKNIEDMAPTGSDPEPLVNMATITDPDTVNPPYKPVVPIIPPVVEEVNPEEKLTKEVVKPTDIEVAPGDSIVYKFTIKLTEAASRIKLYDDFKTPYLEFDEVKSVQVNGVNYSDYTQLAGEGLKLQIDGDFVAGDVITVNVKAHIAKDAPVDSITYSNTAIANVDGTDTNEASAVVRTEDAAVVDGDLYTSKEIVKESHFPADQTIQPKERITYAITIRNETNKTKTVEVYDDLAAQGFWDYFDQKVSEANPIILEGDSDVVMSPTDATVSDLVDKKNPIELTIPSGSTAVVKFTLKALPANEMPISSSEDILYNIATIDDGDGYPYNPLVPIHRPDIDDKNPVEVLTKDVIEPADGVVAAGDKIKYEFSITLTEVANKIQINDEFDTAYLEYDSLDSVQVNGVDYTEYETYSSDGFDIVLTGDFKEGDIVTVVANAHLSADAPDEAVTYSNSAIATVDGTDTDEESANVHTEDAADVDGDLYTSKQITNETGVIDSTIEPDEDITYAITIRNETNDPKDVIVYDDLASQGFWQYFDQDASEKEIIVQSGDSDVTMTPEPATVADLENTVDPIKLSIPANKQAILTFTLHTLPAEDMPVSSSDEVIYNIATIDDGDGDPYNPLVPIQRPDIEEKNPVEVLEKKVTKPRTHKVTAGSTINYKLSINLTEAATKVEFKDNFETKYLEFDELTSVKVNGVDYTDYLILASSGLNVVINGEFEAGDEIAVYLTAHLSEDAPEIAATYENTASAKVDGTPTNNSNANVHTDGAADPDGDLFVIKNITNESINANNTIEPDEEITYTISIRNDSGIDKNVKVSDDLTSLGFWEFFDQTVSQASSIIFTQTGGAEMTPSPATVANLENPVDPITIAMPANSTADLSFTLTALSADEMPVSSSDELLYNIATIDDGDGDPYNPLIPIQRPDIEEKNPVEEINKTVISPTTVIDDTTADTAIQYQVTIGELSEKASSIIVQDNMSDDYLRATSVEKVEKIASDGTATEITSYSVSAQALAKGKLLVVINDEFAAGETVQVTFNAQLLAGAPSDVDYLNLAKAYVDGVSTGNDSAYVTTDNDGIISEDPDLAASKDITNESGDVDGQLEYGEEVTYAIILENTGDVTLDNIVVKDDLTPLEPFYNWSPADTVTITGDVLVSPSTPPTIGSLNSEAGIELMGLKPGQSAMLEFTLTGKSKSELADVDYDSAEPIINIATVEGGGVVDPIDPGKPIMPPFKPEDHVKENFTKEVSKPKSGIVNPGDEVVYNLNITLTEAANVITFTDNLESSGLSLVEIDSVKVNGRNYSKYISLSTSEVNVIVSGPFEVGTKIDLKFTAKVTDDALIGSTYSNTASGTVDGIATDEDSANIAVGPDGVLPSGDVYVEKSIIGESINKNNIIEPDEVITYQFEINNTTDTDHTYWISDDLVSQGFANYYTAESVDNKLKKINVSGNSTYVDSLPVVKTVANIIDPAKPLGIKVPARAKVQIQFDLNAKSEDELPILDVTDPLLVNQGTVYEDSLTSDPYRPSVNINKPIISDKNPVEPFDKQLIPSEPVADGDTFTNVVSPNDTVSYQLTIGELTEQASEINVIDQMDSKDIKYTGVKEVKVIASDGTETILDTKDYVDNSHGSLDLTINYDFTAGDTIVVVFLAHVNYDAIESTTISNTAYATVDGIATNNDNENIIVEDTTITTPEDSSIFVDKRIINETGKIEDKLEAEEKVTYQLIISNTSDVETTVTVKDDFTKYGIDQMYNYEDTDVLDIESDTVVIADPGYTIGDLQTGFDLALPAGSEVKINFTLQVKPLEDIPYTFDMDGDGKFDDTIINIAQITEIGKEPLYPGVEIITPDVSISPIYFNKSIKDDGGDGLASSNEELTYTIDITNPNIFDVEVTVYDDFYKNYIDAAFGLDIGKYSFAIKTKNDSGIFTPIDNICGISGDKPCDITSISGADMDGDGKYDAGGLTYNLKGGESLRIEYTIGYSRPIFDVITEDPINPTPGPDGEIDQNLYNWAYLYIDGEQINEKSTVINMDDGS